MRPDCYIGEAASATIGQPFRIRQRQLWRTDVLSLAALHLGGKGGPRERGGVDGSTTVGLAARQRETDEVPRILTNLKNRVWDGSHEITHFGPPRCS